MTIRQSLKANDYFSTTDLALASVVALFYPLEAIDYQNSQKALFLFIRDQQLDELVQAFWRGELKVEPQAYFNQLKSIKTRLYSEGRDK